MRGNKFGEIPTNHSDRVGRRVGRLVTGRTIRKKNKENDVHLREDLDNSNDSSVEHCPEGINNEGCGQKDGKPIRQRLLVVANRLPVSAVRRGEDVWSLEISAGGLVSALLGMCPNALL